MRVDQVKPIDTRKSCAATAPKCELNDSTEPSKRHRGKRILRIAIIIGIGEKKRRDRMIYRRTADGKQGRRAMPESSNKSIPEWSGRVRNRRPEIASVSAS